MKNYYLVADLYNKTDIVTSEIVDNEDEIKELEKKLHEDKLPDGVTFIISNQKLIFYKLIEDDNIIKRQIELKKLINQKKIINILTYFIAIPIVVLTIMLFFIFI